MKTVLILLLAGLANLACAEPVSPSEASFEKLRSLTGEWIKEGSDGKSFYISFQSSANGSVLIENWIRNGASHSLTLYHPDGDKLMATHYCPQGNQPRLRLASSSADNTIVFVFQDATNLESLDTNHQHSLAFEFIDENTILRKESYSKSGIVTPSSLTLIRR